MHTFEIAKPNEKILVDYSHFYRTFEKDYAGSELNIRKILNANYLEKLSFFKMPQWLNKLMWKMIGLVGRSEDLKLGPLRLLDGYFHQASLYTSPKSYRKYLNLAIENKYAVTSDSVLIHVRKGDYTNSVNSQIYYNCEPDYFQRAIEEVKKQIPNPRFFIMSNDNSWVEKNFTFLDNYKIIGTENAVESFKSMCLFSNFVISNSTFSWWPALLAHPALVVAPKKWFLAEDKNSDVYPKEWIKV
ncbi:MAG: alpha-1,2-fucosyltransferase [Bdellovibrionota bacterium]